MLYNSSVLITLIVTTLFQISVYKYDIFTNEFFGIDDEKEDDKSFMEVDNDMGITKIEFDIRKTSNKILFSLFLIILSFIPVVNILVSLIIIYMFISVR